MDAAKERDGRAERYWRLRTWLEAIKLGAWLVFQWLRDHRPFGLF